MNDPTKTDDGMLPPEPNPVPPPNPLPKMSPGQRERFEQNSDGSDITFDDVRSLPSQSR